MPNIVRGQRMSGLMVYLAGEGRANEHTEPHLVAGDPAVMAWHADTELDRGSALAIARHLDQPRTLLEVEVPGGHVWHCSLSLRAGEGQLTDERWGEIAEDFAAGMGFTEASGKAGCRWVAVRHGTSTAGNDHIHLAVSLVRENGTKASVWNDRPRAQRLAGELEVKYGLEVLESRQHGLGERGVKRGEVEAGARRGQSEPARLVLARTVRGCAAASADEAEFVRRTRRAGLLVRPRYAADRTDVIAGYSVAVRPSAGERAIWYGGGHLARDLTLPRLRQGWTDTPQLATAAVAEWTAAGRGRRQASVGREALEVDPALWQKYSAEIGALRERLRSVDVDDRATWAHVARETSGAFSAWSLQVEAVPGPLAETAAALARSGQIRAYQASSPQAPVPSVKGAALLVSSIAHGGTGTVAQAVLLRQLARTAVALHDAHQAVGQAQRAEQVAVVLREQLTEVRAALPPVPTRAAQTRPGAPEGPGPLTHHGAGTGLDAEPGAGVDAETVRLAHAGQQPLSALRSPLPTDLGAAKVAQRAGGTQARGQDNDHER